MSGARCAPPLPILDHNSAAREHHSRHACDFHALVEIVIGLLVMGFGANGVGCLGVPDHDIGIAAWCDNAFLWIDAEQLSGIGTAELDPAIEGKFPSTNSRGIEHHHAILDAWAAVRNLREVVVSQLFAGRPAVLSALEPEWAVVGGDSLKVVDRDRFPQCLLVALLTIWGRADPLGAFKSRS